MSAQVASIASTKHYDRTSLGRIVKEGSCAVGEVKGKVAKNLQDRDTNLSQHKLGCTPRIERLRMQYAQNRPTLCLHRAQAVTEAYRETEGQAMPLRRGHFFKKFCEQKPIIIQDDELIVGNPGCQIRSALFAPDHCWEWLTKEEADKLSSRSQDPYLITEEQKHDLVDIVSYWQGKSLYERNLALLPPDTRRLTTNTGIIDVWVKQGLAMDHITLGCQVYLFPLGYSGIKKLAEEALAKLSFDRPEDQEKIEYLQAVLLCCGGIRTLAQRHTDEARAMAEVEQNPERRRELLEIAEVCEWVPWNPPRTFREALQSAWFAMIGGDMEHGHIFMPGRMDQDLWPYYEKDIREGRITKEEAQELIECFFVKEGEIVWPQSEEGAQTFAGYQAYQNWSVGGIKRDGTDAVNELTYMAIEACGNVRLSGAGVVARVNRRNPDSFVEALANLARMGTGYPAIYNDDVGIPGMLSVGVSIEDAFDYSVFGCSEWTLSGKMWKYSDGGQCNLPAGVEFALNDGYSRVHDNSEGRWGLPTGDPRKFASYEEVEKAFLDQLAYLTKHHCIVNMVCERAATELTPFPFLSSLMEDCIGEGKDYVAGGCKYNVGPAPSFVGLADAANSLAAVKKFVFDEQQLTMEELIDALDNDFAGREDMRLMLLNRGPKYGRDDPYVDAIARKIADQCHTEVQKYWSIRGVKFASAMFPISSYVPLGKVVGALPSGRSAGAPIADGISPVNSTDRSPTEVINSVCSYDHIRHENGLLLNMRFTPAVVKGEEGLKNFAALIRSFCDGGGWHIQFNCVDSKTLRAAQERPEEYTSLMVRVAGYSAYFNDLHRDIQDTIISRTEHSLA